MTATAQNRRDSAAESEQERQERVRALRQRAKALNVPTECAAEDWAASTAGCLINLCEYGEFEEAERLKRVYWNIVEDYNKTRKYNSKAVDSIICTGGGGDGPSAIYDEDSEGYIEWCNQARARFKDMEDHLKELQNSLHTRINVKAVRNIILDTDENQPNWHNYKYIFPQLRKILDSLGEFWGR